MKQKSSDIKVRIQPDTVSRTVQGEEILLNLVSGFYFGLNRTGTRVWDFLKKGRPMKAIVSDLAEEYDVAPTKVSLDVTRLLKTLEKKGLIAVQWE